MVVICRYYICKWKIICRYWCSNRKKNVKGEGLLYGGYLQILYQQIKLFVIIGVPMKKKHLKGGGLLYGGLS